MNNGKESIYMIMLSKEEEKAQLEVLIHKDVILNSNEKIFLLLFVIKFV